MSITIRYLTKNDVDRLMELEKQQWSGEQLPSIQMLIDRIQAYPDMCVGAFCHNTGKALASLFFKPSDSTLYMRDITWGECAKVDQCDPSSNTDTVFGISLTSIHADAANGLLEFLYPRILKMGIKYVYMGSPIPGFSKAKEKDSSLCAVNYVNKKHLSRSEEPYDPQLNYYYRKGFHEIVSVQKNYFPHERSLDYGVILKNTLPLSEWCWLWNKMPLSWIINLKDTYLWLSRRPNRIRSSFIPKLLRTMN